MIITQQSHPKTWDAFSNWLRREGCGADSIDSLSDEGWREWFPDFLIDVDCGSADAYEGKFDSDNNKPGLSHWLND